MMSPTSVKLKHRLIYATYAHYIYETKSHEIYHEICLVGELM